MATLRQRVALFLAITTLICCFVIREVAADHENGASSGRLENCNPPRTHESCHDRRLTEADEGSIDDHVEEEDDDDDDDTFKKDDIQNQDFDDDQPEVLVLGH
ncbi:hypothetical protein F511_09862 [Dorcoceras hygrometricum]|uniref:Uncharacterized protein n=1 Tax=Dorcoceras hygrometricum TaxID=472368 RepID=A0A2Z7CJG6_9LAMI|nr:hypothetical protein F511_09862 [Dorcoceras hygrometricum]